MEKGDAGNHSDGQFYVSKIRMDLCERFTRDSLHMENVRFRIKNVSEDGDIFASIEVPLLNASLDSTVTAAMSKLLPRLQMATGQLELEFEQRVKGSSDKDSGEE